jgi:hypothetical protein
VVDKDRETIEKQTLPNRRVKLSFPRVIQNHDVASRYMISGPGKSIGPRTRPREQIPKPLLALAPLFGRLQMDTDEG